MANLRNYVLKIGVGERQEFPVRGNILGLITSNAKINFQSFDDNSNFDLVEGQEAEFKTQDNYFKFQVSHNEVTEQTIVIAMGTDARIGQRKTVGEVIVKDYTGSPIPVIIGGATITASNVTISQKPVTIAGASYTVTAAGVAVSTAANKDRRSIHFRNTDTSIDCYLAAFAAGTKADCPILLRAGECLLIDDRTAAGAWIAYSDGANIAVKVQEAVE